MSDAPLTREDLRAANRKAMAGAFGKRLDEWWFHLFSREPEQERLEDKWNAKRREVFESKMAECGGPWPSLALPTSGSHELDEFMKVWEQANPRPWKEGWIPFPGMKGGE